MKQSFFHYAGLMIIGLLLFSCSQNQEFELEKQVEIEKESQQFDAIPITFNTDNLKPEFKKIFNKRSIDTRSVDGLEVELYSAEFLTIDEPGENQNVVFFSDNGNKQLAVDFLGGDPRSLGGDLTVFAVDNTEGATASGLSNAVTEAAIDRAMGTWDDVKCSDILLAKNTTNSNFGFVSALFGYGGNTSSFFGDVQHAGWLPGAFFDFLAPGGSNFILGVTFTLTFTQDLNGDGVSEVAFREIYYNDNFPWNDGATYDVETVALHEAGHGLSQAHFGKAFLSGGNGKLHFSPRAVMNAAYSGVQTDIKKTDNGGHCSNWANWPNN